MLRLAFNVSAYVHSLLQICAPTNVLARFIRTRRGHKWGLLLLGLSLLCIYGASVCTILIDRGASPWLHLVVVLLFWDSIKLFVLGLQGIFFLVRARLSEGIHSRRSATTIM